MATNVNTSGPPLPLLLVCLFFQSALQRRQKREKMASSARSEDHYYERITSAQQSIHEREKRRLELERELFAYSRSDKRALQIKCSKLRSYLKEICDREARAKMRNLELLRDVECIEISMKEYSPDHAPLQQQKAECLKKISKFMEAKKKMEREPAKAEAVRAQHQDGYVSHPAKDFKQAPVEIFMGHQTSRGPDAEAGSTSVHSHQALHHSPNRSLHSRERLPSGLLKDFTVGGEDAASNRAHLSDDISGSNDSPDDGPEKNPSPGSRSPTRTQNSIAEHTDSKEVAHEARTMEDEERGHGHLMLKTTLGKEAEERTGKSESVSTLSSDVELSESTASDLSISLTQSELEEDAPEGGAHEGNDTHGRRDHNQHSPESSLHSNGSKKTFHLNSKAAVGALKSLSQEGLFNLLDSIEGRLRSEQASVYGDSSVDGLELSRIISLCDDGAGLNDEDLGACGAVVLHELQRLSWSTEKGCLLPQDLVCAHQASTEPNEISTSLPPNAARLWDRWFKHALVLKERRVLSTERLVQLFTPLLLSRHATYSHQAKVLLRTLLSRSSEECPSAEDTSDLSSLCGPPSLLADGDAKPARPVWKQRIQELQSAEEDSQDESPVESGPIRETKAYQLLKQSAMMERRQSSEEEEEDSLSGINHGHEEDLRRAKSSSHQDPYPRREKASSKAHSTLQSKDFWGQSDDSNSEIEAALRPQPFNSDGIYDFYE
ncbi:centrosomal protein kizuna isoform X3 [Astatotilapia calliptera]|uniref:centrosomal protein kizuna isoform X3 n=1 Tax=Astatotilapia calliptera TaxID=8154 RepID=UPI000E41C122|nr:centrosomal protein kizuna isoform X3 [Astatotilapia calliptera]